MQLNPEENETRPKNKLCSMGQRIFMTGKLGKGKAFPAKRSWNVPFCFHSCFIFLCPLCLASGPIWQKRVSKFDASSFNSSPSPSYYNIWLPVHALRVRNLKTIDWILHVTHMLVWQNKTADNDLTTKTRIILWIRDSNKPPYFSTKPRERR